MPVPGKKRGGPDFLLLAASATLRQMTLVGDLAITSASNASSTFATKMTLYKTFSSRMNATTLPLVFNIFGGLYEKSSKILVDQMVPTAFIRDLSINGACTLIKSLYACFTQMAVRPDDEDDLGAEVDDENDEHVDDDP